jgi:flagellar biosynthetic protein FlhB
VTFSSITIVVLVLLYQSPLMMQRFLAHLVMFISQTGQAYLLSATHFRSVAVGVLEVILPVSGAAVFAGAAAVLLQTRFLLTLGALQPKFSRVSPAAGLRRVFGFNGLVEVIKSLAKLASFTAAIYFAVRGDLVRLIRLPWQDPHSLPSEVARPVFHLLIVCICVHAVVAGADLMWVRFRHAQDLRMTKQDLLDELKDTDGNPQIKARIRRIRMIRARKRMMAKVPGATVVVTNPTHYAVALAYDRTHNPAPRIVAKGTDSVAARIREVAIANGVPLVANPILTRALYQLDLDSEIPAEHYKAVAEIIAYVWRLRQTGNAVG